MGQFAGAIRGRGDKTAQEAFVFIGVIVIAYLMTACKLKDDVSSAGGIHIGF